MRTPLTGLLGYLEICKRLENVSDQSIAYIDKAMRKAMQIRELSDNLFDCFLSSDSGSCHLEPPARAESLLEDHFSEMFTQLECSGFSVNFSGLRWDDVLIQADLNFLGRIVNNMLSNLNKYADKKKIVLLSSACRGGYFGISVENAVKPVKPVVQGTRIGVENIENMMKSMNGKCEICQTAKKYRMTLWFRIIPRPGG